MNRGIATPEISSSPSASDPLTITESKAPAKMARLRFGPAPHSRIGRYPASTPAIAMLKTLAPSASTPPSWNTKACMAIITVITRTAGAAPSVQASNAPPTRWPLVPTPTGKLII